MNKKVYLENYGFVNLTDKEFVASGGEASIYKISDKALKIYHDKNKCISSEKINELKKINSNNVFTPLSFIFDENNDYIGYSMNYSSDSEAICKLFTKNFKVKNNISSSDITELVKKIQSTIIEIHKSDCLVVDLNEMNILVDKTFINPVFIDVDSYQTKSYPATAIMESIRDRKIRNDHWNELSDWFSFAVIIFQLYIGIHPYKGSHPDYKQSEWMKRMDNNISVFDKKVSLPSVCENFNVIPNKYLDWMKKLFVDNLREIPPVIDSVMFNISNKLQTNIIQSNQSFLVQQFFESDKNILDFNSIFGINYISCSDNNKYFLYKENKLVNQFDRDFKLSFTDRNDVIVCLENNGLLEFNNTKKEIISKIPAKDFYTDKNKIFSIYENNLIESEFININGKYIHKTKNYNISYASKLYQGCIIQNLLGKKFISFIENNYFINLQLKELENHRILECERQKNFAVIIAEKDGFYDRFVINFDFKNMFDIKYDIRISNNIDYNTINFLVLNNGLAILLTDSEKIELFRDNNNIKVVENSPFNNSMKLFEINNNVFFIDKNKVFSLKLK